MQCNVCNSNDFDQLFSNFKRPSARIVNPPTDVLLCKNCGFMTLDTSCLTQDDLDQFYGTFNTFNEPGQIGVYYRNIRQGQVEWVLKNLPEENNVKRILDIGCGNGYILSLFKDKGYDVYGNDLSPDMIDGIKRFYDIDGFVGNLGNHNFEKSFDLITAVAILEHVLDPDQMFKDISKHLIDQGFAYIEVPDSEFPYSQMVPDHIAFLHLSHWTERTLGRQMENHGFEIIAVDHIDNTSGIGNPAVALRMLGQKKEVSQIQYRYKDINDYDHQKVIMEKYKTEHDQYLYEFQNKLKEIAQKTGNEPVAIRCGGEHTATLLERFDFSGINLNCIFDTDKGVENRTMAGLPIYHVDVIKDTDIKHFILSTTNHEKDIYDNLKTSNKEYKVYGLYQNFD